MSSLKIVLAAGGTGGHVFPAEALAQALLARGHQPVLMTDTRGKAWGGELEGVPVYRIRSGGIAGLGLIKGAANAIRLARGVLDARAALRQIFPRLVVGFGGYAALPAVAAASWLGLPTAIHEQNAVLGRANRLLARYVGRICTAFAETGGVPAAAAAKVVRVGMPVRPAFLAVRDQPYAPPAATGTAPLSLLILGGSQGAQVFSEVLPAAVAQLPPTLRRRLRIAQQCRPELLDLTRAAYGQLQLDVELQAFFNDVPERLARAHLVIARAGSSTIAELTTVGRPAILVPYPYATDDHQTANAKALADEGAAWLLPQASFDAASLAEMLRARFEDPATLAATAAAARALGVPDATTWLADAVLALVADSRPQQTAAVVPGGAA